MTRHSSIYAIQQNERLYFTHKTALSHQFTLSPQTILTCSWTRRTRPSSICARRARPVSGTPGRNQKLTLPTSGKQLSLFQFDYSLRRQVVKKKNINSLTKIQLYWLSQNSEVVAYSLLTILFTDYPSFGIHIS